MPPKPPGTIEIVEDLSEGEAQGSLDRAHEDLVERTNNNEALRNTEILNQNEDAFQKLNQELTDAASLDNFSNRSADLIEGLLSKDPVIRFEAQQRGMAELLGPPKSENPAAQALIKEDQAASERIDRGSSSTSENLMFALILLASVATVGIIIWLSELGFSSASTTRDSHSPQKKKSIDDSKLSRRMINITSMVMEATDDNPGTFNKLGISQGCYGKVREAVLNNQFNMPESLWWQVLAEQAAEPYPNTDTLLTPANHYMALGFCLGLLKPLYPAEPMDVDVDAVVETLASSLNLLDPACMAGYYASMLDVIPEDTGANRAQRIFLARAGLARAFSRLPA